MKKVIVLCFFMSVFVAGSAFAQQAKVVVIPLNNKSAAGTDKQIQFNDNGITGGAGNVYFDKATGLVGINTATPTVEIELNQSNATIAGVGGMGFTWYGNMWKIFHSGIYFSFVNAGTRVAYVHNTTGAWIQASSRALKTNIAALPSSLDKTLQLNPVSYNYRTDTTGTQTYGFIAEEVESLFPELVSYDEDGIPGLNYAGFGPVAIRAIQEQQQQIEQLRQETDALKNRIAQIEQMLNL